MSRVSVIDVSVIDTDRQQAYLLATTYSIIDSRGSITLKSNRIRFIDNVRCSNIRFNARITMSVEISPSQISELDRVLQRTATSFFEYRTELTRGQFSPISFGDHTLSHPTYRKVGLAFISAVDKGEIEVGVSNNEGNRVILGDNPYIIREGYFTVRQKGGSGIVIICLLNPVIEVEQLRLLSAQLIIDCVHKQAVFDSYGHEYGNAISNVLFPRVVGHMLSKVNIQFEK